MNTELSNDRASFCASFLCQQQKCYNNCQCFSLRLQETYPSTPPVWFSESDNANVTNALTSLSETSGINNHLSYQVKSLLRQLCTLFSLPLPVECTDSDSNSSGCSTASSLTPPRSDSASIGKFLSENLDNIEH